MLFFTWYLLAAFHIHPVCATWTASTPTRAQYLAAGCADYLYARDHQSYYMDLMQWDPTLEFNLVEDSNGITTITRRMEREVLCVVTVAHEGEPTAAELVDQCADRMDLITAHDVSGWLLYGSSLIDNSPACTLPAVDNSGDLTTAEEYQFLQGRLSWWGVDSSVTDWQNRWDDSIRGAADAAGIPANLLKKMIAAESQFWPLWTGSDNEVGWLQVTWDGADTALRHDGELFARYCPQAIDPLRCARGYDLLAGWEKSRVETQLINDLRVTGTPLDASTQAARDLWTYAHIVRAYACYAQNLYPSAPDVWSAAAVLYNAGTHCLSTDGGTVCEQGRKYLELLR